MSGNADEKCWIVDRNENGNGMIGTQNNNNGQKESPDSTVCDGNKTSILKLLKAILSSYVQFIQSPSRQDSILKTVQYSLWLLSKFYRGSGTNKHRLPHRVAESLLKLQGEISWARYVLRFFGFPAAINDVANMDSGWATGNNANRIDRVMSWSMVAYYPLENLAYLLWKGPGIRWLPIVSPTTPMQKNPVSSTTCSNPAYRYSSAQLASKASAWSCRFWLTWIVLDIVRCTMALQEIKQTSDHPSEDTAKPTSAANDDGLRQTDSVEEDAAESLRHKAIATIRTEHMRILRNALYVLPAINWSLPQWDTKPWLSGDLVNGLCWVESVIGLYQGVHDYQRT